jgi:hypothetical protein
VAHAARVFTLSDLKLHASQDHWKRCLSLTHVRRSA